MTVTVDASNDGDAWGIVAAYGMLLNMPGNDVDVDMIVTFSDGIADGIDVEYVEES